MILPVHSMGERHGPLAAHHPGHHLCGHASRLGVAGVVRGVDVDTAVAGFVRGQGTLCLILGIYYAVGLTLTGLNFGLLIGMFAGLISFIPYVGSLVGLVLSVGVALVQFWPDWIMVGAVAVVFFVGQFVEGNILQPIPLMDQHGADAVRWFMAAGGSPWAARRVGHGTIQEVVRKTLLTYWNTVAFQALYARTSNWAPSEVKSTVPRIAMPRADPTWREVDCVPEACPLAAIGTSASTTPPCWSSAPGAWGPSAGPCSGRSAPASPPRRPAPWR